MADPMAVTLWAFTGPTLVLGRSTCCGWLRPFGALQELIAIAARAAGLAQAPLALAHRRRAQAAIQPRLSRD